jgi:hypothetical protein
MKNIKEAIDVSGKTITKIGNMTWKQVLTFFVVILIILGAVAATSYIVANKAAKGAVETQLIIQQQIHDYEMKCDYKILLL